MTGRIVPPKRRRPVGQRLWSAVDAYIGEHLIPPDPVLDAVIEASIAAGLPPINVSATQGKLLHLLACLQGARRILEIGTLGGYSTIWLARALPRGGSLITLEVDPAHAAVARSNFARAGLDRVIELREGPALETLPRLAAQHTGPFDFIFIDADKPNIPEYLRWAVTLSRSGTGIVVDNVVRDGELADAASIDANVIGVRRLHDALAADGRVSATSIQTVGTKGYDGFTLIVVDAPGEPAPQRRKR